MKLEEILEKKNPSMKDKKLAMMYDMLDRLHKDLSEEELNTIHKSIKEVWRNHHPIENIKLYCKNPKCFHHFLANKKIKGITQEGEKK